MYIIAKKKLNSIFFYLYFYSKYPKTDYTYSEYSPYRREIAAGYILMPNMSRRSLELHNDRVNIMVQNNPEQESFIRKRYQSSVNTMLNTKKYNYEHDVNNHHYDSQDEVDLTEFDVKKSKNFLNSTAYAYDTTGNHINKYQSQQSSMIKRFFTIITTTFYSCLYGFTNIFKGNNERHYSVSSTEMAQENGI